MENWNTTNCNGVELVGILAKHGDMIIAVSSDSKADRCPSCSQTLHEMELYSEEVL